MPHDIGTHNEIKNGVATPPVKTLAANDGVVDTLLQVLPDATTAALVVADHAGVLGYYRRDLPSSKKMRGLLDSHSDFSDAQFIQLWDSIADTIAPKPLTGRID